MSANKCANKDLTELLPDFPVQFFEPLGEKSRVRQQVPSDVYITPGLNIVMDILSAICISLFLSVLLRSFRIFCVDSKVTLKAKFH